MSLLTFRAADRLNNARTSGGAGGRFLLGHRSFPIDVFRPKQADVLRLGAG